MKVSAGVVKLQKGANWEKCVIVSKADNLTGDIDFVVLMDGSVPANVYKWNARPDVGAFHMDPLGE